MPGGAPAVFLRLGKKARKADLERLRDCTGSAGVQPGTLGERLLVEAVRRLGTPIPKRLDMLAIGMQECYAMEGRMSL